MEIGLSFGSNLGDRLRHLREARRRIASIPGVRIEAESPVYETEPVDVAPPYREAAFLNAVLIVESEMEPRMLARELHRIEAEMGRVRGPDRNSPRTIDLDMLYAGRMRLISPELTVPHPRWAERRFVVQPLADVRPDLVLPGETRAVRDVLAALPDRSAVVLFARRW